MHHCVTCGETILVSDYFSSVHIFRYLSASNHQFYHRFADPGCMTIDSGEDDIPSGEFRVAGEIILGGA